MAANETVTREYVVLHMTNPGGPARGPDDGDELGPVVPEQWSVVDTVTARSDDDARKQVVRSNLKFYAEATLVAIPKRFWTPQKPKVREQEPIIDFEDV